MEIQNHCDFCSCYNCKRFDNLHKELERWSFHNLNKKHDKFIILHQIRDHKITLFPVYIKNMSNSNSKYITVKYFAESEYAKEPY